MDVNMRITKGKCVKSVKDNNQNSSKVVTK